MAVDVRPEILINRPKQAVAEYMFDPRNDAAWTSGVIEVKPLTEGRLKKGSRVERVVKFMGKTFGYVYEVTDAGEDFVEIKVDQPFPMRIRYELKDSDGGTLAAIRAQGDPKGFFKLAGGMMSGMVFKNISKDLALLKAQLEKQP